MLTRFGGCNCGGIRFEVDGEPVRVGLCHCKTCRREIGAPCNAFAIWTAGRFRVSGETRRWEVAPESRHFCPVCGSSLFSSAEGSDEIEIRIGALDDAPSGLNPAYELWVVRRETWMSPVPDAGQFTGDRP